MAEVIPSVGAHVGSTTAQAEIAIEDEIEYIRVAGVDAGGIIRIAAVGGHEMEIAICGIAEEGVDAYIAYTGNQRILDITVIENWRNKFYIQLALPIIPDNVICEKR